MANFAWRSSWKPKKTPGWFCWWKRSDSQRRLWVSGPPFRPGNGSLSGHFRPADIVIYPPQSSRHSLMAAGIDRPGLINTSLPDLIEQEAIPTPPPASPRPNPLDCGLASGREAVRRLKSTTGVKCSVFGDACINHIDDGQLQVAGYGLARSSWQLGIGRPSLSVERRTCLTGDRCPSQYVAMRVPLPAYLVPATISLYVLLEGLIAYLPVRTRLGTRGLNPSCNSANSQSGRRI